MLAKYRAGQPNAAGVERALRIHGAPPRGDHEDACAYLERVVPVVTVPFAHAGLHRYAFAVGPHARSVRIARPILPNPKAPFKEG
jgi:hypothetical protein